MSRVVRVTVLVENTAQGPEMLAEHGLAFWIETDSRRLLFDTGQGTVLPANARHLNVPVEFAEAIILSHGHYDHTGGLGFALGERPKAKKIYAHPDAFQPKYARNNDGTPRAIGMPPAVKEKTSQPAVRLNWTRQPTEICDGVFVTGEIPRVTDFEDTGGPFFADEACTREDPLLDDQAFFFESRQGVVVLLGCAHAGVVNTLQYISRLTEEKRIHSVMGGMHLVTASPNRMAGTIDAFRRFDVQRLGPSHCTGLAATAQLWTAFPKRCFPCPAGTTIDFERS